MKKKILLKGPLLTRSGYGEQARFALRSLRSREDLFDIFIQPLSWGRTSWTSEMDEERNWIDQNIEKTIAYVQSGGKFDISLQVTIPNEFQKIAPINIGYTAGIETTKVAHQWIPKANEMDKIIVVSSHSKQVFENTEYQAQNQQTGEQVVLRTNTPVESVGYPVKSFDNLPELDLGLDTDFNFLTVAQFGPRKNLPNLIKWFVEEFRNENVGLVVKTNIAKNNFADRSALMKMVTEKTRLLGERQCKVFVLHGDMTDAEMHSLYQHPQINAFVSLPHGEGFGLPIFEAAYSGLPVVATGWSGQLDFLTDTNGRDQFYNVAFDLQQVQKEVVWDGVVVADSMWAYAREGSAKEQMRACRTDAAHRDDYAQQLRERFSEQAMYDRFVGELIGRSKIKPKPVTGISFCIPTNGARPEKTNLTIKSIQREMGDFPHEIIIAGDIENFMNVEGVTVVSKPEEAHSGRVATLRNIAGDCSKFDTIAWCDDDIILGKNWLTQTIKFSQKVGWNVLANKILLPDGGRCWDRATISPHQLVSYEHPTYDKSLYQTSGFFLIRKHVFNKIRWDDECLIKSDKLGKMPEDVKYSKDLILNGEVIFFNRHSLVWHNDENYHEISINGANRTLLKDKISEAFPHYRFTDPHPAFERLIQKL